MPGVPAKPNNQVVVREEPQDEAAAQPRQPQNLQGLLRYAVEAANASSSNSTPAQQPQALDDERKRFLEDALKSMTVDVISLMQEQIEILKTVSDDIPDGEVDSKIAAFDKILDYISNIDIANDFHKINGFQVFDPCMKCRHDRIRAAACDLLAELAQNNPYIQEVVCNSTNLMKTLLGLLETDPNDEVQIKALYAISCITRDCDIGYANLKLHNGLGVLRKALSKDNDKLRTKITFLLTSIHRLDKDLIRNLVGMDFLPVLIALVKGEWKSTHEHVLSLLHLIAENNGDARKELHKHHYNLQEVLEAHLGSIKGKEEFSEEEFYCNSILKMVFR